MAAKRFSRNPNVNRVAREVDAVVQACGYVPARKHLVWRKDLNDTTIAWLYLQVSQVTSAKTGLTCLFPTIGTWYPALKPFLCPDDPDDDAALGYEAYFGERLPFDGPGERGDGIEFGPDGVEAATTRILQVWAEREPLWIAGWARLEDVLGRAERAALAAEPLEVSPGRLVLMGVVSGDAERGWRIFEAWGARAPHRAKFYLDFLASKGVVIPPGSPAHAWRELPDPPAAATL